MCREEVVADLVSRVFRHCGQVASEQRGGGGELVKKKKKKRGPDDLEFTTQEITGEEKCKQERFPPPEVGRLMSSSSLRWQVVELISDR